MTRLPSKGASVQVGGLQSGFLSTTHVRNTIVAGNTSGGTDPDVFGTFISTAIILLESAGGAGFGNPGSHDQVGTLANPADPKLGPLLDHGGYTATMAPLLGSLVIDQGKRGTTTTEPNDFDQRGFPRPTDQAGVVDAVDGDGSDIGAVELEEYQLGPNFTVTTTDDHDYGVCGMDFGCTLREALNAANAMPMRIRSASHQNSPV